MEKDQRPQLVGRDRGHHEHHGDGGEDQADARDDLELKRAGRSRRRVRGLG